LFDEPDVFPRDVVFPKSSPESSRFVFTDQFIYDGLNHPWRIGRLELEHVTFGQQPVSQIDAFQVHRFAIRRDKLLASPRYKL
jgi:hypothetical protein